MNYRLILNIIGRILCVEQCSCCGAAISLWCGEQAAVTAFSVSILVTAAVGAGLFLGLKPVRRGYFSRDGFVTVGLAWIIVSLCGCLPLWLSGAVDGFVNSLFETISGFTTTGSTISLTSKPAPGRALLAQLHPWWGPGRLVFLLAIGPRNGDGESK
jgi:trk system potassium uptake protein TrkH